MFKKQLLVLLGFSFIINACSMFGKKIILKMRATFNLIRQSWVRYDGRYSLRLSLIDTNFDSFVDTNSQNLDDGIVDINSLFGDLDIEDFSDTNLNETMNDTENIYQDVIQNMQDEITKLKSELDRNTEELYKLKAQSQIRNNLFYI